MVNLGILCWQLVFLLPWSVLWCRDKFNNFNKFTLHTVYKQTLGGGGVVNQGVYVFLGCFYKSQKEKWVWTLKKNVKRDNVIYHGTQQKMGFHLVFFWVLWSILVLQTLLSLSLSLYLYRVVGPCSISVNVSKVVPKHVIM